MTHHLVGIVNHKLWWVHKTIQVLCTNFHTSEKRLFFTANRYIHESESSTIPHIGNGLKSLLIRARLTFTTYTILYLLPATLSKLVTSHSGQISNFNSDIRKAKFTRKSRDSDNRTYLLLKCTQGIYLSLTTTVVVVVVVVVLVSFFVFMMLHSRI